MSNDEALERELKFGPVDHGALRERLSAEGLAPAPKGIERVRTDFQTRTSSEPALPFVVGRLVDHDRITYDPDGVTAVRVAQDAVAANDGRDEPTAHLLVADQRHLGRLDHGVGRLDGTHEPAGLDHA